MRRTFLLGLWVNCTECRRDKALMEFEAQHWCGSPGALHSVCAACQSVLRAQYAVQTLAILPAVSDDGAVGA